MNIQKIKTKLITAVGFKAVAYLQALRFLYLLKTDKSPDPEVMLLKRFLRKGDTAVDIGANAANWTYYLYNRIGSEGNLFAFEADPYYGYATEIAIKMMGLKGVHFFSFGLSNKSENVPLRIMDSNGLRFSGLGYIDKESRNNDKHTIVVKLEKLDSMLEDFPDLLKTKLIKCDVEGYELFVFQGATQILDASRPFVILEVGNYDKHGYTENDLYNFFLEMKYSCFAMISNNTLSATDCIMNHDRAISANRVLIPIEKINKMRNVIQVLY